MTDVEKAKFNPASIYQSPKQLMADQSISKEDKISILEHWEDDERERLVAEEENMLPSDNEKYILDEIRQALDQLGASHAGHASGTKHG